MPWFERGRRKSAIGGSGDQRASARSSTSKIIAIFAYGMISCSTLAVITHAVIYFVVSFALYDICLDLGIAKLFIC